MTEHLRLIAKRLTSLEQMRKYLLHSTACVERIFPVKDWKALSLDQHDLLAAFRVRFSEFQEHLSKTMRAVAIEEEADTERFGAVLAFMEKLGILESTERWKLIRELRNAINHEYEEESTRLSSFFTELLAAAPELLACHDRLRQYCEVTYADYS